MKLESELNIINGAENLQQSEKDLRTLFESIDDVFFSIDIINNKVIQVSNACHKVYGYPAERFLENADLFSQVIHPNDKERIGGIYKSFLSGEFFTLEYRIIRADNEVIWVQSKVKPTLDPNGKLVRIDGVVENIKDRKNVELRLESKIKELNLYIYRTTHDLRGPILSALGLVYLAQKEVKDEIMGDYLNKIEESNKRLDFILLNLVEVIRTLNDSAITLEKIDFNNLINDILLGFEHNPKRIEIDIKLIINTTQEFYSDKILLSSMIFNLVQNSINYHRKNRDSYITIEITDYQDSLYIVVTDNGIGIPPDIQTKVFDMFYRGNEDSIGSGLGLYIVKNAVEKLGGKIKLKSESGKGTSFSIILPFKS